jgi:hypothetical protein
VTSFVLNSLSSTIAYAADIADNDNFSITLVQQVTMSVATLDIVKTKPWPHPFKSQPC